MRFDYYFKNNNDLSKLHDYTINREATFKTSRYKNWIRCKILQLAINIRRRVIVTGMKRNLLREIYCRHVCSDFL